MKEVKSTFDYLMDYSKYPVKGAGRMPMKDYTYQIGIRLGMLDEIIKKQPHSIVYTINTADNFVKRTKNVDISDIQQVFSDRFRRALKVVNKIENNTKDQRKYKTDKYQVLLKMAQETFQK